MLIPFKTQPHTIDIQAYTSAVIWRGFYKNLITLAFVIALGCVLLFAMGATIAIPILLLAMIPVGLLGAWGRRYLFVKRFEHPKTRSTFLAERTLEIDAAGIRNVSADGVDSRVPWARIVSAEQRGPFILLFMTVAQHWVLPLTAIPTQEGREALLNYLRAQGLLKSKVAPAN